MLRTTLLALIALGGTASAARLRFVVGGTPLEVGTEDPLRAEPAPNGTILTAIGRPPIFVGASSEACIPSDERIELAIPKGVFVRGGESPAPWRDVSWTTLCVQGEGVTLDISIQYFDPVRDPEDVPYVRTVLGSLVDALRPPITLAPRLVLRRTDYGPMILAGTKPGEVIYEGISYTLSVEGITCPKTLRDPRSRCLELADRAAVLEIADAGGAAMDVDFGDQLIALAEQAFGRVKWLGTGPFTPAWANGALPLSRVPNGTWKLLSNHDRFELRDIVSGAHLVVARSSCSGAEAARAPAGAVRVAAPRFLPSHAGAAWVAAGAPWIATACFPLLGADVAVRLELAAAPNAIAEQAYAHALSELIDAPRATFSIGAIARSDSGGVAFDVWYAGKLSAFFQIEGAGGREDKDTSMRFNLGLGTGISRPDLRAGIHAGIGLDVVPIREPVGSDRSGGSLFLEARGLTRLGPLMVQGNVRGTFYYDIDCTEDNSFDEEESLCGGPSNHSDFDPLLGWEAELRVGLIALRSSWKAGPYFGVRVEAVSNGDRTERGCSRRSVRRCGENR